MRHERLKHITSVGRSWQHPNRTLCIRHGRDASCTRQAAWCMCLVDAFVLSACPASRRAGCADPACILCRAMRPHQCCTIIFQSAASCMRTWQSATGATTASRRRRFKRAMSSAQSTPTFLRLSSAKTGNTTSSARAHTSDTPPADTPSAIASQRCKPVRDGNVAGHLCRARACSQHTGMLMLCNPLACRYVSRSQLAG